MTLLPVGSSVWTKTAPPPWWCSSAEAGEAGATAPDVPGAAARARPPAPGRPVEMSMDPPAVGGCAYHQGFAPAAGGFLPAAAEDFSERPTCAVGGRVGDEGKQAVEVVRARPALAQVRGDAGIACGGVLTAHDKL